MLDAREKPTNNSVADVPCLSKCSINHSFIPTHNYDTINDNNLLTKCAKKVNELLKNTQG